VSTSFPTLVTMGGIAPDDACPPPAVLTKWRCYACHDSPGGSNMVNLCSGEQLWQPPASDWDVLEWDIGYSPNPEGTWYRVPGSRRWVHLDYVTSWIHIPTKYTWYLVEDTARPLCARPSLPHQIELILTKFTLRRMILTKRGGDAMPVASGRSLSPTLPHPMSYVGAILSTLGGDCQPSSHVLQSTTANESAVIMLHQTARRRKRPRRRPGRRNGPRAPNRPNEAIPSHPLPTMGGMSPPTTTHPMSAHANDRDHRSIMSSPVPPMTLPSPSHHPFTVEDGTSTSSGGDSLIPSASQTYFFHRGSHHDESTVLVVFVGVMAPELPIRRTLHADADIGLGPPTSHPRPLRWWDLSFGIYSWILVP